MPPRTKTPEPEVVKLEGRWTEVDGKAVWQRPHAGELCDQGCGLHPLPAGATQFSCEHGTWDLDIRPAAKPGDPPPVE